MLEENLINFDKFLKGWNILYVNSIYLTFDF